MIERDELREKLYSAKMNTDLKLTVLQFIIDCEMLENANKKTINVLELKNDVLKRDFENYQKDVERYFELEPKMNIFQTWFGTKDELDEYIKIKQKLSKRDKK